MTTPEDPHHPVVDRPWTWKIVTLHFQIPTDGSESFIDLELCRTAEQRRLRFFSPQGLEIEKGFPNAPGLVILDVSKRGLDGLNIHVDDFEGGPGGIRFWARAVQDISSSPR